MTTFKSRMLWLSELKWIATVLSLLCFMSATCSLMRSPALISVSPTYTILLHSAQSKPYITFVVSQLFLRSARISMAFEASQVMSGHIEHAFCFEQPWSSSLFLNILLCFPWTNMSLRLRSLRNAIESTSIVRWWLRNQQTRVSN